MNKSLSSCRTLYKCNIGGANTEFALRWIFIVCKLEFFKKDIFTVSLIVSSTIYHCTVMSNVEHFLPSTEKNMVRTSALIAVIAHPSVPSSVLVLYFFLHACMNSSSSSIWEKYWASFYRGKKKKKSSSSSISSYFMFHKVIKWLLRWLH